MRIVVLTAAAALMLTLGGCHKLERMMGQHPASTATTTAASTTAATTAATTTSTDTATSTTSATTAPAHP
jgi:hypothetical protein